MADYTLSAVIKLKDELSKNVDKAKSKLKTLDKQFDKNTISLNNLKQGFKDSSEDISKAISTITKVGTGAFVGIVAGGWAAYKEYADLNQVMKKNSVLLGANADEAKKLEEQVAFLGKTTAFTSKEVAQAQKYQIMAGYDLNKVLETTPKLLKLAIVAEEDLGRTSDLVTDTMDALGLKTQDLGRYLDVISNVANKSNTSVSGLMEAFLGGASTGVAFGESLEDTATLLGILANNGKKGAEAGTFLNAVTANFAANSLKNQEMIKEQTKHGIRFYKKTKEGGVVFKGMTKIIEELRPKLAKMTEAQRNQFLVTMVGKEHLSDFIKLLNASPESFKSMENAAKNSEGALEDIYSGLDDTHLNNIKKLQSAFEGLRLEVGKAVAPVMLDYIKQLTSEINNLKSDDIKKFVGDVKVVFDALAITFKGIVETLKIMKDAMEFNYKLGTSLGNVTQDVATFGATAKERADLIDEINNLTDIRGEKRMDLNSLTSSKSDLVQTRDELLLKNLKEKPMLTTENKITETLRGVGSNEFGYKPITTTQNNTNNTNNTNNNINNTNNTNNTNNNIDNTNNTNNNTTNNTTNNNANNTNNNNVRNTSSTTEQYFEKRNVKTSEAKKEIKISFGDVYINNGMDKDKFFKELTEVLNYA